MIKKLIASFLAMAMMVGMSTTVFAQDVNEENKSEVNNSETININVKSNPQGLETYSVNFSAEDVDKRKAFESFVQATDKLNAVYGMNGTNGDNPSDLQRETFKSQQKDNKMYGISAYASSSPTDVWIGGYGNICYGNNTGYSQLTSDAQGYLWAEGLTGYNSSPPFGDYIESWGGTSIGWFGTSTPKKMRITEYVQSKNIGVSLSFPAGIGFSGSSTSISREVVQDTNIDMLGAELPTVRAASVNTTGMERTAVGYVTVGSYTYSASSTVNFKTFF